MYKVYNIISVNEILCQRSEFVASCFVCVAWNYQFTAQMLFGIYDFKKLNDGSS